jgi:hypothetical protein
MPGRPAVTAFFALFLLPLVTGALVATVAGVAFSRPGDAGAGADARLRLVRFGSAARRACSLAGGACADAGANGSGFGVRLLGAGVLLFAAVLLGGLAWCAAHERAGRRQGAGEGQGPRRLCYLPRPFVFNSARTMRYISTRGQSAPQSFCDILLGGLAPDGGLYLPESYPQISRADLDAWRTLSYAELAFAILSKLHRRHSRRRPQGHLRQDLHCRGLRLRARRRQGRRDHPGALAGAGQAGPAGAFQRPDPGLQGHGDAAVGQSLRIRAR